jgi:hypothetical protein
MIRDAIRNKQQVLATYDGHQREMCPHVLGSKNGRQQALFYQFGGSSRSGLGAPGSSANWRCIPITGLRDVSVRTGAWHSAPNHSRPQTCVDVVDVEVSF